MTTTHREHNVIPEGDRCNGHETNEQHVGGRGPTEEQETAGDIEDPTEDLLDAYEGKDSITSDKDTPGEQTFYNPFSLDLVKPEIKPGANPLKWLQRIFAIVKSTDKSAEILTDFGKDGRW